MKTECSFRVFYVRSHFGTPFAGPKIFLETVKALNIKGVYWENCY